MHKNPSLPATVLTAPATFHTRPAVPSEPRAGEVLVRVIETGLCGSDVTMYLGRHPVNQPPLTLGHEFYGELVSTGDGNEANRGDVVAVFPALSCDDCANCRRGATNLCPDMGIIGAQRPGALAGVVEVPSASVLPIDPATPPGLRVLIEPLAVALHAVNRAGSVTGRRCAVLGAGAIGTLVSLVLHYRRAEAVYRVDTDAGKFDFVDIGTAYHSNGGPLASVLGAEHGELDVIFDCVGSAALAQEALGAVRPGGTVVLVGVLHDTLELDGVALQRRERAVVGVQLYVLADFTEAMHLLASEPLFSGLPANRLIRRNAVHDVQDVFDRLARGASTHLKETILFAEKEIPC
jgi:L-iditol 2-dehydrogenase